MRFDSSAGKSEISRKLDTWRSGRTSRCVSAFGAMSLIATKASPSWTCSPSRTSWQNRQSSGSADPLLRHLGGPHPDELADRRLDEPRRVVVAVAPTGAVDEDDVLAPELLAPAGETGHSRRLAQARASLPLRLELDRVGRGGPRPGPRRVREDVD